MTTPKATVAVEAKPAHRSSTLWANLLVLIVAIATLPEVQAIPAPEWVPKVLAAAAAIGNIVLRFITVQPVAMSTQPTVAAAPAPPDHLPVPRPPSIG